MKYLGFLFAVLLLTSCIKGVDYCEPPMDFTGFKNLPNSNNPNNPVKVEFLPNAEAELDWYEKGALINFSVPDVFVNPKGDGRLVDVVTQGSYTYVLKDPANAPDSVVVSAYVFTDCGRSTELSTVIRYN